LLVETFDEAFDKCPDRGALFAADALSAAGAAGLEVVGAGRQALAEDDLAPFVVEELGVEAVVTGLGE
jgi:hypothetical protein